MTFGYAYNPASQIASSTISNDLYAFGQANAGIAATANGLNQLTAVGGGAVVHDSNGNLTQEGGRTLGYDSENRLVSASSTAGGSALNLAYDPQGRFRAVVAGTTTVAFDMTGTDIVAGRINAGAPIERHVFAPGTDEPMVTYDNAGTRLFYHADGHGSGSVQVFGDLRGYRGDKSKSGDTIDLVKMRRIRNSNRFDQERRFQQDRIRL